MTEQKKTTKRPSYKKKAQLFEKAYKYEQQRFAKVIGLLETAQYLFGIDTMVAITKFHEDPTEENKLAIRDELITWFEKKEKEALEKQEQEESE